jgi:hypothetical protein
MLGWKPDLKEKPDTGAGKNDVLVSFIFIKHDQ